MEEVIKKLDYEWDRFFLDLMRTSKPNIFAKSTEIERKKYIVRFIKKHIDEFPKQALKELYVHDNIMEAIYCSTIDYRDEDTLKAKIEAFILEKEGKVNGEAERKKQ